MFPFVLTFLLFIFVRNSEVAAYPDRSWDLIVFRRIPRLMFLWIGKRNRQQYMNVGTVRKLTNRPFSSCLKPLFQSEGKCKAIDMEIIFYFHANETHIHNKGFAFSLVLKARVLGLGNGLLCSFILLHLSGPRLYGPVIWTEFIPC